MDLSRLGRNLLFALIILVIVRSIGEADLPATQRVEEYIAFVLTTDFDYGRWLEEARALDWFAGGLDWRRLVPWMDGREVPAGAPVAAPDPGAR